MSYEVQCYDMTEAEYYSSTFISEYRPISLTGKWQIKEDTFRKTLFVEVAYNRQDQKYVPDYFLWVLPCGGHYKYLNTFTEVKYWLHEASVLWKIEYPVQECSNEDK